MLNIRDYNLQYRGLSSFKERPHLSRKSRGTRRERRAKMMAEDKINPHTETLALPVVMGWINENMLSLSLIKRQICIINCLLIFDSVSQKFSCTEEHFGHL